MNTIYESKLLSKTIAIESTKTVAHSLHSFSSTNAKITTNPTKFRKQNENQIHDARDSELKKKK
jgi:hypothetical protein